MKTKLVAGLVFLALTLAAGGTGHCGKPDFVIAIDIGHSTGRPGAVSARGDGEFRFNRGLATLLLHELAEKGFTGAFLINEDGADMSLAGRAEAANKRQASLFLSIHHDSVQPRYLSPWSHQGRNRLHCELFHGYSLFYSGKNKENGKSLWFADLLGSELRGNGLTPTLHHAEKIEGEGRDLVDKDKGIYRFDDLAVLKAAAMPAVLLECGIIVNRDEELLLTSDAHRKTIVRSVASAIERYYERAAIEYN